MTVSLVVLRRYRDLFEECHQLHGSPKKSTENTKRGWRNTENKEGRMFLVGEERAPLCCRTKKTKIAKETAGAVRQVKDPSTQTELNILLRCWKLFCSSLRPSEDWQHREEVTETVRRLDFLIFCCKEGSSVEREDTTQKPADTSAHTFDMSVRTLNWRLLVTNDMRSWVSRGVRNLQPVIFWTRTRTGAEKNLLQCLQILC